MSELEKLFYGLATSKDSASNIPCLDFDDFKSALTEALKLVEVTDEEIEKVYWDRDNDRNDFILRAKYFRDLSKTKLEKLIG